MRLIDWEKGGPYTWTIGDYEELSASEMMFARKFDIDVDERIIFQARNGAHEIGFPASGES